MSETAAYRLLGEVESSRPLRAHAGVVSVSGWSLVAGLAEPPAVRLATAVGNLPLSSRKKRLDLPALLPGEPAAARCGFTIAGHLPEGVYLARLEAQLPDGSWSCFKSLSLVVEARPFTVGIESPAQTGKVSNRVEVEGWALDPRQAVEALTLRYGHQEIPCTLNRPRADVALTYPDSPHAARSGFKSKVILSAGRGPLRLRAKLADGSVALARTVLQIDVATDENHDAQIDFGASRIPLAIAQHAKPQPPPVKTDRPLNVLFLLPGSFASNSALHVAALANELCLAGHACAVAVPHDIETLAHHATPLFRGLLHREAESGVIFAGGRGPQVIHVWTTRENVRALAVKLRIRHGARVVVHLEDNEQEILALSLGRPVAELEKLSAAELARLVPADLTHPHHGREFLAKVDAVTVIIDKLRELVPAGRPCHTVWPAADARWFHTRSRPDDFRRPLETTPGETVLFYHGNVHAANAAEVRELYLAVLRLNQAGSPVKLIRTGLDQVDFLGSLAAETAPHVLSLGQILHHHHLPPLMALADIFVQPGWADAFNDYRFPSKLPEFFSIGRPVVLPRTNLGTSVRHGLDAYVLERADAAGITAAVTELRRDRALYDRLSSGALAFAAARFSWRRSAEALGEFYRTVCASTAPPPAVPPTRRIVVTGGRGRLASLIADHFSAKPHPVELCSRRSGEGFQPLANLTEASHLAGSGTLLHLAWSTLPATSEKGGGTEWQDDLPALEKILQAITTLPPASRPHFVFFSSGGTVYGSAPGRPSLETDPCQPIGCYGKAKRAAEAMIESHVARHGLDCAILRISNPYGYPVPRSRAQGIIPHAIRCAVEGQTLTLWGDGHARKDFLYYTDFLAAVEQIIARRLTGTFNVCAGESHSVREVIALVENHTAKKIALAPQSAPLWDVADSRLDNRKIVAATGWRPQVSFAEGIRRSVASYAAP